MLHRFPDDPTGLNVAKIVAASTHVGTRRQGRVKSFLEESMQIGWFSETRTGIDVISRAASPTLGRSCAPTVSLMGRDFSPISVPYLGHVNMMRIMVCP